MLIEFSVDGEQHSLACGQCFLRGKENVFRDTAETTLRSIIQEIEAGEPWRNVVYRYFAESNPWLYDIITHPNRDLFFRQHPPKKSARILDIGSGWGQIALPLAKNHRVCAVEPTSERLDFVRAAAKGDGVESHIWFINADYMDVKFKSRFDLITCIGVLEWVGAFNDKADPRQLQKQFLKKIRSELTDSGKCVIGIENRLGLKYLLGAPDDHIGIPDIAVFDAALASRKYEDSVCKNLRTFTYTLAEYRRMLYDAGFNDIEFYAAFPDYKLPRVIKKIDHAQHVNNFFIDSNYVPEHNGANGKPLANQEELKSHYQSLSELGIAHFFVPSFFIGAS